MSASKQGATLRVLILSNMYPPHHLGGYELSCRDVVARWRARGHDVEILTSDLQLADATEQSSEELGVRRVLRLYWDDFEILKPPLPDRLRIERWNHEMLRKAIAEFRPDVISSWNMGAMSLGMLSTVAEMGIPLVLVMQDNWLIYAPLIDPWMSLFRKLPGVSRIARWLTGVPTTFRPPSSTIGCYISDATRRAQEGARWAPARSTITYNGIDSNDFPVREPKVRDWAWNLLYVGRVEERKGVGIAVEALASLPQVAVLSIVGPADDAFVTRLRSRIDELGLRERVRFENSARSQLHEIYSAADALLFPVLWDEPFGLVPLEAMACATPVIATGTGGSAEFLIDEANCLLTDPGDASALADAVRRMAGDGTLRDRIIEGGLITARNLNVDEYARVLEVWHRAAAVEFRDGEPTPRPLLKEILAPLRRT